MDNKDSRQPDIGAGLHQGGAAGRDEIGPDGVVMLDDLGGRQVRPIARGVAVRRNDRRIATRQRAAHGGIDAIVGRPAGDDQSIDRLRAQERLERGLEERVAGLLVDDGIVGSNVERRQEL